MDKKKLKETYKEIRNLQDFIDYMDDLIAKRDHAIYLLKKNGNLPKDFLIDDGFTKSSQHKNFKYDLRKYFQVTYNIDFDGKKASQNLLQIIKELKYEIKKREELLEIREGQVKSLLDIQNSQAHSTLPPKKRRLKSTIKSLSLDLRNLKFKSLLKKILRKTRAILRKFLNRKRVKPQKPREDSREKIIAYVVNALAVSGGMQIVIRHVNELKKRGYNVVILTFTEYEPSPWLKVDAPVHFLDTCSQEFLDNIDIMIATHWSTAPFVSLSKAKRKVYFVQSDERRFILEKRYKQNLIDYIEDTYKADMEFMTEAIWIQRWLKEEFDKDAYYVPNGLDTEIFHKTEPIEPKGEKPRVLIEGQINYWLKGMEEAYEAIKDIDCDLWIVSSWGKPPKHWKYNRFFEKVPFEKMKNLYSSCDIFLKMSKVEGFFGPPMEAMACGCAVIIGKVSGYDEYIKDKKNALVVESGDINGAKKAIKKLIENNDLRKNLIKEGLLVPPNWSWEKSINHLEKMIAEEKIEKYYTIDYPQDYSFEEERKKISNYIQKREQYLFR